MKLAINMRPVDGPWGGGNRFVRALAEAAERRGHRPVFDLEDDVDLALIIDPRVRNPQLTFSPGDILSHVSRRPETVVVHRINECDERKGTRTMNVQLRLANYCADHTVFIASWLKRLNVWRGEGSSSVILNGADEATFRRGSARTWDGREPLRIVTHHWGAHANKGWDAYRRLDALIGEEAWRGRIAFTYIGNLPASEQLRHGVAQEPLDGDALAAALADHHVYLTASVNEPAGMHHVEGALVGLPLIYRESGALPEYCGGFGEAFRGAEDMVDALARMVANYPQWKQAIAGYSRTADRMTGAYVDLFEKLHEARGKIAAARRPWRNPVAALLTRAVL